MNYESLEITKEVAGKVAIEAYKDTLQPTLKETGEILALIPRAIKVKLLPLEKYILNEEYNLAETKKLLAEKLKNVAPEQIVTPEAYIGVPALQYISYCMDSDILRDMYANLLAKSMYEVTRNGVHPSFLEIIKQLSPDEAKILSGLKANHFFPVVTLSFQNSNREARDIIRNFSDIGEKANCEFPEHQSMLKYFDNMERLGLIRYVARTITDKNIYESLIKHSKIESARNNRPSDMDDSFHPQIFRGHYSVTQFGGDFIKVCIEQSFS